MTQVGLIPSEQLASLDQNEEGVWLGVPEGQTVVPLVKVDKPAPVEGMKWLPSVTWFSDRVERGWTQQEADPEPVPAYVTDKQLRYWLVDNGHYQKTLEIINTIPDSKARLKAQFQFNHSSLIYRTHPMTLFVMERIPLTPTETDAAFIAMSKIAV
jgi:hypothetical protein